MALTDGRDPDAPVTRVNAGEEPAHFACHFIGWDHHAGKKAFVDPYEMKLKRAKAANPTVLEMPTLKKTPERRPPGPSASASGDYGRSRRGDGRRTWARDTERKKRVVALVKTADRAAARSSPMPSARATRASPRLRPESRL